MTSAWPVDAFADGHSGDLPRKQPRLGDLELFIGQQSSLLHLNQLLQLVHHVAPAACWSGRGRRHHCGLLDLLRLQGRYLRFEIRELLLRLERGLLGHLILFLRRILLILTVADSAADRGSGSGDHRRRRRRSDQSTPAPWCRSEHLRSLLSRYDSMSRN
jgi:hypothetical protein